MKFDTQKYSYASRRTVSFAKNGMVATSSPLPAQVGLDVLKKGGNAIDAAVATAAALSVIEPTSNGIGADSFALIWYKGKLYGLNGSGRSPRLISGEKLLEKGYQGIYQLLAIDDCFVSQATVARAIELSGLDAKSIVRFYEQKIKE